MTTSQEENRLTLPDLNKVIDNKNNSLISTIVQQEDTEEVKKLIQLFNLNNTKKQMIRSATYNQLLDHIMDQMSDRVTQRADQFSNKDLLDYMNTMNSAMEKAQKQLADVDAVPTIQINQQNNIVNMGEADQTLDRESRRRVLDAVASILNKIQKNEAEVVNQEEYPVSIDDISEADSIDDGSVDSAIAFNNDEEEEI